MPLSKSSAAEKRYNPDVAEKAMAWMLLLRPWSYAATVVPFLVAASVFGVRDGADWRWWCVNFEVLIR